MESEDMDQWAEREKLTPETVRVLKEEGFDSLEKLSQLTSADIDTLFVNTNLLIKQQCLCLKKAVERMNTESSQGQAHSGHVVSSAGQQRRSGELEAIIRFVLVGNGGTGKSTTGNTILGANKFVVSRGLSMETSKCEMHRGTVLGETVEVVDTPDLSSTSEKQIGEALAQAAACMPSGPHAFLFLLSLSRRFTKGEVAAYQRLLALFDEFVTRYMIVVFTGGDDLGPECTINDILVKAPPDLRSILETCDNRYVVFNNKSEDRGQVRCLLDVARDLMQHNGNQCYSWPRYFSFHDKTQEEISKRIAIVTKLESKSMKHFKQLQDEIKILEEKERSVSEKREEKREIKTKGFQFCLRGTFQKRKQEGEKLEQVDLSLGLGSMLKF